jgi:hypothetical protein
MNGCELGLGKNLDLGLCAHSLFLGWVPDWVWVLLPYWPWIVVIGGAGMAYRFAGWPGVVAFAGGLGFLAGKLSNKPHEPIEQLPPDHPDAAPSHGFNDLIKPRKPIKSKPIGDDWLKRMMNGKDV